MGKKTKEERMQIRKQGLQELKEASRARKQIQAEVLAKGIAADKGKHIKTAVSEAVRRSQEYADQAKKAAKGLAKAVFNHPSYYEHFPELLELMMTPNFAKISGVKDPKLPMATSIAGTNRYGFSTGDLSIPKVAGVSLKLVRCSDSNRFRIAIDRLYQILSNANNGVPVGTRTNLAELIVDYRAAVAIVETGRRAYGTLKKFELLDESVPMAYFAAMGLDYQSFAANSANLKNELNLAINNINSKAMFKLDLFNRTKSLFGSFYKDNQTIKNQEYLFRCLSVIYCDSNDTIDEISVSNDALGAHNTGMDYASYISRLHTIVDLLTSKDIYSIIRGNIIKAEGLDLYELDEVVDEYETPSIYDEYCLQAVQNCTLNGEVLSFTDNLLTKPTSDLLALDEKLDDANYLWYDENPREGNYLNIYKDRISNSELISITRLTTAGNIQAITDFGTEVAFEMVIPYVTTNAAADNKDYDLKLYRFNKFNFVIMNSTGTFTAANVALVPYFWALFDWMPACTYSTVIYDAATAQYTDGVRAMLFDFANFAWVDEVQLPFFHKVAIANLLFSPMKIKETKTTVVPGK